MAIRYEYQDRECAMRRSQIADFLAESDARQSLLHDPYARRDSGVDDRSTVPESFHQRPTYADNDTCRACGDPLSLDRQCTCTGDPDRDVRVGLRELKWDRTMTLKGMRQYPLERSR